jgi:diadenosine tetraphosphate (Ap4A) HIT family hydrolase
MCLFCDLIPTSVKDSELSYFIFDKYPQSRGHSLIIPKRHIENVFELTDREWGSVGEMINTAKAEIEKDNSPLGYNILINCGKVAGQTVMHAHIHLIPKY